MDKFEMLLNKLDRYPVQRWELLIRDAMTVIEFEAEETTDYVELCQLSVEYSLLRRFMSCNFEDESTAKATHEIVSIVSNRDYSDTNIGIVCGWFKSAIDKTVIECTIRRYNELTVEGNSVNDFAEQKKSVDRIISIVDQLKDADLHLVARNNREAD